MMATKQKKRKTQNTLPSLFEALIVDELLIWIFRYLSVSDLVWSAGLVCRRWSRISSDRTIWRPLFETALDKGVWGAYPICLGIDPLDAPPYQVMDWSAVYATNSRFRVHLENYRDGHKKAKEDVLDLLRKCEESRLPHLLTDHFGGPIGLRYQPMDERNGRLWPFKPSLATATVLQQLVAPVIPACIGDFIEFLTNKKTDSFSLWWRCAGTELISRRLSVIGEYLFTLNLEVNNISFIPLCVAKSLVNLTVLRLGSNKLKRLPDELGNCKELHALSVDFNGLEEVPRFLSRLPKLVDFIANNNRIERGCEVLCECPQLRLIDLAYNRLTHLLPGKPFPLTLTSLDLSKNRLISLPDHLMELTNLRTFHVDGNSFRADLVNLRIIQREITRTRIRNGGIREIPVEELFVLKGK
jgi:hypothetical protein